MVRVTNRRVAAAVGDPVGVASDDANWTATLTLHVDRTAGVLDRATFRYADEDESMTATYRVRDYRAVDVHRPPGTLPLGPRELLYRLDLGVRTLAPLLDGGDGA